MEPQEELREVLPEGIAAEVGCDNPAVCVNPAPTRCALRVHPSFINNSRPHANC